MARTALTVLNAPAQFAKAPTTLTFAAGDAVNFNSAAHTGREYVIARNTDGVAAHTLTVKSAALNNRTGDLTQSIPAGGFVVTQVFPVEGWQQSDGKLHIDVDDAQITLAVVRIP